MEKNKKKILFFLPSSVGGAERITITIAKFLDTEQFEVKFVIVSRRLGDIIKFIPKNYGIIHLSIKNIWCFPILRIYKILRKEKPNSVFCSLRYLSSRLIIAARLHKKINIIVRCENGLSNLRLDHKLLMRYTYPHANCIIAQQEEMRQELIQKMKLNKNKIITLQNPIDIQTIEEKIKVESPYKIDDTSVKYVWVGRFAKAKGQDVLVKAFEIVHKHNPNVSLYLIGKYNWDCSYDKSIKDFIIEHKLSHCIHCIGFDENPYRWVKHCDCFVLPSRLEGLPNALIEALYLHIPVVATKCIPVISRIVNEGKNGYMVPTEDFNAMAEAMTKAIKIDKKTINYTSTPKEYFISLFK